MAEYIIGKKGDFKTFAEVVPNLADGDVVTFNKGLHPIEADDLTIHNLTLRGTYEDAYSNTMVLISANKNDDTKPAFRISENGGLAISSLSIVVAPKVRPFVFDSNSVFTMRLANIVWNHFKLQNLNDNLPLLTTETDTTVMAHVEIVESIVSSMDLVSRHLDIMHTALGSPYGQASYISGFTNSSTHNYICNTDIAMVGEIYSTNILGEVKVVDTNEQLAEGFPNLKEHPLVMNNLLFQKFDPKAVKVGNTWNKNAEALYKKQNKGKANTTTFYMDNERIETPLYIIAEPKGKGSRYAIPHDKGLLINHGNIVIRGENNAQTTWPNVQASGTMVLANYKTGIPYRLDGGDLMIKESSVRPVKGGELVPNIELTDLPLEVDTITEEAATQLLWTPDEILAYKLSQTPIYNHLTEEFDKFILEASVEQYPVLLIGQRNSAKTVAEVKRFVEDMSAKQVLRSDRLIQFTGETLEVQSVIGYKQILKERLGFTWMFQESKRLLDNPDKDTWYKFLKNVQQIPASGPQTLLVFTDKPENLDKFQQNFKLEYVHRYDVPE